MADTDEILDSVPSPAAEVPILETINTTAAIEESPEEPSHSPRNKGKEKVYDPHPQHIEHHQGNSHQQPRIEFPVPLHPDRPVSRKNIKGTGFGEQTLDYLVKNSMPFAIGVFLTLVLSFVLFPKNDGMYPVPTSGTSEWRTDMIESGLSKSYINADSAAVELYHQRRQLSHHPIEHVSYIIPAGTPWNVKKYFMDRVGTSMISGESSLADAERKGFYIRKSNSFVLDRYIPSIRNVAPSLLSVPKVVEEVARHRDKYVVSKNLFGCVSSHTLGITAKFVILRVSDKKLAVARDPRSPIALDYLEKVANVTRMTFPEIDPKGVYFYILDAQILPETDDLNVLLASRPNREKPVNYKDILGLPTSSNHKSVTFLIENRIHGNSPAPKYYFSSEYVSFTAPGEVAIRYLNIKTGVYESTVVKGELIGCIEKSQRYANAKGFDSRRLVSREFLEGKMEEAGDRRGALTSEQRIAEENKRREAEKLEKQMAEIQARLAEAKKPAEQPQYRYDDISDISDDEEAEMKASDASFDAISSVLGTEARSPQRPGRRDDMEDSSDNL